MASNKEKRDAKLWEQLEALEKAIGPELLEELSADGEEMPEAKCEKTGWRWECPICETWNDIPRLPETDYCSHCGKEIKLIAEE